MTVLEQLQEQMGDISCLRSLRPVSDQNIREKDKPKDRRRVRELAKIEYNGK